MTENRSIGKVLTIPNVLTLIRFLLIGVLVYFFVINKPLAALTVYLIAFATDILDGYIARTFNQVSNVGKAMDPIADKAMTIAALTCMFLIGYLHTAVLVVIIIKELLMIVGGIYVYFVIKKVVQANAYGKLAAGAYFLAIVMLFLHDMVQPYDEYFMYVAVAMNLVSIVQYGYINIYMEFKKRKTLEPAVASQKPEQH
jgi:cardiolipin synthase